MYGYRSVKIFGQVELQFYLEQKLTPVIESIGNEGESYLLNVNDNDYIEYKFSNAYVEPLCIYVDKIYASSSEQMIPAEYFPRLYHVIEGKQYKKDVIKFHIPFSGDSELFNCIPSSRLLWTMDIEIDQNEFCFEVINFDNDASNINRTRESSLDSITQQLENVTKEVERYNSSISSRIKKAFEERKQKILTQSGVLASLGIPIKKSHDVSPTFSVPAPKLRKSIDIQRPIVNEAGFVPEPTLEDSVYHDILGLIHDVGKEFERLPSLYADKEEEHLRDHFLMMLEPHFEGTATGETFNKSGKTDILLRHNGENVFIAECKFWRGKKGFLSTITQLLGYLTWRDSKAAVIMFVTNKDFSSTIEIAKTTVIEHSNYLSAGVIKDETWLNCIFHLNHDRNRKVNLAVLLYHMPR